MPNLRIVRRNAADLGTPSVSSQFSGNLGVANLRTKAKSEVWRATSAAARYSHSWTTPETIGLVAFPYCNLSPDTLGRLRVTTESSTTNQLSFSPSFAVAYWTGSNMTTSTAAAGTAPDGTNTAFKLIPTATAAVGHYYERGIGGLTDNARYSGSVYVKRGEQARAVLTLVNKANIATTLEFNFDDGRVTCVHDGGGGIPPGTTFDAKDCGNGWWRLMTKNFDMGVGATTPKLRVHMSAHTRSNVGMSWSLIPTPEVVAVTPPEAGYLVEKIKDNTTFGAHHINGNVYSHIGKTVVLEAYLKWTGVGTLRHISFVAASGTGMAVTQGVTVNISTGAIIYQMTNDYLKNPTVTDAGDGWWKVRCEVTPSQAGSFQWQIRMNSTTTTAIASYAGDATPSEFLICKPYAYWLVPDNTLGPVSFNGRLGVTANGTTDGTFAWGGMLEPGAEVTSYYPAPTGSAAVRPLGYMDDWQSYNYDSGYVACCPGSAQVPDGWTAVQAASAYAYGGGMCARQWLPTQMSAYAFSWDLYDVSNLQGYIEASRMVAGQYWEAATNPDYGSGAEAVDRSKSEYSEAGDLITENSTRSTKLTLDMSKLNATDRAQAWQLMRANGTSRPVFASLYPNSADGQLEQMHQIYGQLVATPSMKTPLFNLATATIDIQGV